MTTGCHALESEPENNPKEIRTIYPSRSNYTQCYNMPSGHKFALKISAELPKLNMVISNKFVASVLEENYHYMYLYEEFLVEKIRRMEFANTKRIQIHLAKSIKDNCRRILTFLAILMVIGKVIGYKTLVLILFAIYLIQPAQAKPTTIQGLYKTLAYVQLRKISNWLTFTENEYLAMEASLIDAIVQLQRTEPQPEQTSTTEMPKPQSNDELINGILHSFVKRAKEKEETKQQDMVYATE
jgi:hypothetical protein